VPEAPDDADLHAAERAAAGYRSLREELAKVIVGQSEVLDELLIALFAGGHCLLLGVPGLAKTLMVRTLADALDLSFNRVQFTPDLMPADITGTEVLSEDKAAGTRDFRFVPGPVFANVVLADEINRTPPKTQAALLEAMQERQVTAGGRRHVLPSPFFVLATQNPIEQEGTYPLPEAQLDRFMFEVRIGYPTEDEEFEIVRRTTQRGGVSVERILTTDEILAAQNAVRSIPVADHVVKYAMRFARLTRRDDPQAPEFIRKYVSWGAGPRASQFLVLAAKARAMLQGRLHVAEDDVRAVAKPVLRHRLVTNFDAEADGLTADDLIERLTEAIPVGPDRTPTWMAGLIK
jgi:MoxR-like ATPase